MTEIPSVDLGNGAAMPMLGFGTWQLQGELAYEATRHALLIGYRHIDTATMYRNEEQVGRAIADSGVDRAELFVTTKLPPGNAGRARATITESLKALGTDYVDLWLVHWPPRGRNLVPLWRDFLAARDDGLTRTVGVSNYSIGQIDDLIDATGEKPAVNQIPWSPSRYDARLLAAHAERGVALEGYSPLKGTRLRDRTLAEIAGQVRRHLGPGGPALAHRHRRHRHPQVRPPRAHRAELRPLRLLPNPRRNIPPQQPLTPPAPPTPPPPRSQPRPSRRRASFRIILRMANSCPQPNRRGDVIHRRIASPAPYGRAPAR